MRQKSNKRPVSIKRYPSAVDKALRTNVPMKNTRTFTARCSMDYKEPSVLDSPEYGLSVQPEGYPVLPEDQYGV